MKMMILMAVVLTIQDHSNQLQENISALYDITEVKVTITITQITYYFATRTDIKRRI